MAHLIGTTVESHLTSAQLPQEGRPGRAFWAVQSSSERAGREGSRREGSPSLRGCEDSLLPPQLNDQLQTDDANSNQVLLLAVSLNTCKLTRMTTDR